MSEAQNVVTSENREEFMQQRMGMKTPVAEEVKEEVKEEQVEEEQVAEAESSEEVHEEKEKKPNSKIEKRFSELTKQREEAKQRAEAAEKRAEEAERKAKEFEAKVNPAPVVDNTDAEPDPAKYTDVFQYNKDLVLWAAKQERLKMAQETQEQRAKEEQTRIVTAWQERQAQAKAEIPDYDAMIASSEVLVSDQIRDAILDSAVGPQLLYHLAENPEVAEKLGKMTIAQSLRELGKLEAKLEKPAVEEKPANKVEISKAAAPITPLKGASVPADLVDDKGEINGSFAAYRAARKAGKLK